jgi:hypothetical protein
MSLEKALKEFKFDKRLLDHNLKTGMITEEEYQKYLTTLSDSANNCEILDVENSDHSDESENN